MLSFQQVIAMKNFLRATPALAISSVIAAVPVWAADTPSKDKDSKDIEQVVITATPMRESAFETAQPAALLSGDDLIRSRAISLGETLSSQPGVSATYFGPQASRPVIRGIGGERVQMYEDGGAALDASNLSNDHSVTIDPLLAQRIEVVRGPATLLYGNGASGGLINVITNRIPETLSDKPVNGALELRTDSATDERSGAARVDGTNGHWAWHADGHKSETDDVRIPDFALSRERRAQLIAEGQDVDEMKDRLVNSGSDTYGGAVGGSYIGDSGFIGLGASLFDTDYGLPDSTGEIGSHIDMRQKHYDLKAELRDLNDFISLVRVRSSYSDYTHGEIEGSGEVGTLFQQKGSDTRVVFDHSPVGGWRGTFGVQFRDVDLDVTGEEALLPRSQTRNTGFFVFEERQFGNLHLETGARLEQQKIDVDSNGTLPNYDKDAVSASLGGVYKLTDDYAVALNVTSTQRHPSATELYADGPHVAAQRFEIGDDTLKRERATTFDLGLRKAAGDWTGAVTAFRSDYSRYIFAALTGEVAGDEDPLPVVQYSQRDATFSGFELELKPPAADLGFGVLSSRVVADYVRAKLKDGGGDVPQIPPMRIGGELTLEQGAFSSGVSVTWYDKQDKLGPEELPTDGYTMVNLDFSYRLPAQEHSVFFYLRGTNLLDEDARRHTSPLKDEAPLPGRGIGAGVRMEL
jgi:iron complex outermembrane receptor protein